MLLSLSFISYKIYTESILRDGLSDGIGVKWKAISLKSAFGSWKLTVRLKVYTSWWVKIRRSQRNTLKISTLERRRLLLNSLHFFLEGKKLIKKKQSTYFGSPIIQDCYWEKEIRSCSCKKGVHGAQWAEIIRVASHKRKWLLKRLDNRKEWPKHGQQRLRSLNCWLCFCR